MKKLGVIRSLIEMARRLLLKIGVSCQRAVSALTFPPLGHVLQMICASEARTILDVGANTGQMAKVFRRLFPKSKIICFEPMADAYYVLTSLAQKDDRLKVENTALGDVGGIKKFNVNKNDSTSSLLDATPQAIERFGKEIMGRKEVVEVDVTTLDDYCEQNKISKIDLLKLDVQGYEAQVLRGARKMLADNQIHAIMAEICLSPLYIGQSAFSELLGILEEHGYKMHSFYGESYSESRGYDWGDAIFVLSEHPRSE